MCSHKYILSPKIFILFLVVEIFGALNKAHGQTLPKIQHLKYPSDISPGEHFTVFCDVKHSVKQGIVPVQLISPPNWATILTKQIPINDSTSRFVQTMVCPNKVAIRSYYFVFQYQNQSIANFPINIRKVHQLIITPINLPDFAKEGDTLNISFSIQNAGNIVEKATIGLNQGKIFSQKDTLDMPIGANESFTIFTRHIIPNTNQGNWNYSPILSLKTKDTSIISVVSIPVYGTTRKEDNSWLRFPLEIGSVYIGTKQGDLSTSAYQFDIRGKGFLDFSSKHYIDFTAHGPNQFQIPMIGSYEIYSMKYDFRKTLSVQLGDYNLRLSNLLEFGRFSRGAKIDWRNEVIGTSFYYAKPRFESDLNYQLGGNVSWYYSKNNFLSAGYQRKGVLLKNQSFDANILNLFSSITTTKIHWETELAQSISLNGTDYAIQNNFNWYNKWIAISSNLIYAGKNFYGFYKSGWQTFNSINFTINNHLSLGISHNLTRINPSFDLLVYNSSPYIKSLIGQLNYRFNYRSMLRLSYNILEREDRLEPKSFYYRESFGGLGYDYNGEKFALSYNGRWGNAENLLIPNDENIIKMSFSNAINPQIRLIPSLWLGGIFEHLYTSKYSATNSNTNYYFYGGSFRLNIRPWLSAMATYRNNFTPEALVQTQSYLTGNLNLDFKHHALSLIVGQSFIPQAINLGNINRDAIYFSLKYTLKLNLPLAKDKRQGTVIGQLNSSDNTLSVGNVMVSLGEKKVLTDASGKFTFNKIIPDKYIFRVEPNPNYFNVSITPRGPIEVQVKNDSVHALRITIARTGIINGIVQLVDQNGNRKIDSTLVFPTIFIRIQNDQGSITTKVNALGEFSFSDVVPGSWNLSAWLVNNQNTFQLVDANQNIQVNPSKTVDIAIGLQSLQRKLVYGSKSFQVRLQNKNP